MLQRLPTVTVQNRPRGALRVFAMPFALGLLSAVGLTAALLGDEVWDSLSWLALGIPIAVIALAWGRAPKAPRPSADR